MRRVLASASLLLALSAGTAPAEQFRVFDSAEQVGASDLIVLGTVRSLRPLWNAGILFTDAELELQEVWKGAPPADRITVRVPGGELGDVGFAVDGAPSLAVGERVVLMLRERDGVYTPWGMRYGKFRVERSGSSEYVLGARPPAAAGAAAHAIVSTSLDELRDGVGAILAGPAGPADAAGPGGPR